MSKGVAKIKLYLDPKSNLDAHVQIFQQIRESIVLRDVRPGEQLPTNKQICEGLGVASRTVQRAYTDLANAGLCEGSKALGTVALPPPRQAVADVAVDLLERDIQRVARWLHLSDAELRDTVDRIVKKLTVQRASERRSATSVMVAGERREKRERRNEGGP